MTTVKKAGLRGTLSATDQDNLAKAIGDYYSPLTRLSYENKKIFSDPVLRNEKQEKFKIELYKLLKVMKVLKQNKL